MGNESWLDRGFEEKAEAVIYDDDTQFWQIHTGTTRACSLAHCATGDGVCTDAGEGGRLT